MPNPPSLPTPSFGTLLRQYRLSRGLSVEQVAEAAQLAPSVIRTMEGGQRIAPPHASIEKLADLLQLGKNERRIFALAATLDSPMMSVWLQPSNATAPKLPPLTAAILAFLIADVRGYTHFTQDQGDEAAARLTTKFADLTRSVVERWDGRLIELRGDEALVVFGSARQALQAALEMQDRFIEATNADPDLPLAVGIGIDVGEAVALEEGYRGAALNRAARLCSMAGAGDVLVTTGLAYVAPKVDGIDYLGRGRVSLKGFTEPVDVLAVTPAPILMIEAPERESQ